MTTKEYTLKAEQIKSKIESLRNILGKVNIPSISLDDNGNPKIYNFESEYMYESTVQIKTVKSELYDISREIEKLSENHFELKLEFESQEAERLIESL